MAAGHPEPGITTLAANKPRPALRVKSSRATNTVIAISDVLRFPNVKRND